MERYPWQVVGPDGEIRDKLLRAVLSVVGAWDSSINQADLHGNFAHLVPHLRDVIDQCDPTSKAKG